MLSICALSVCVCALYVICVPVPSDVEVVVAGAQPFPRGIEVRRHLLHTTSHITSEVRQNLVRIHRRADTYVEGGERCVWWEGGERCVCFYVNVVVMCGV